MSTTSLTHHAERKPSAPTTGILSKLPIEVPQSLGEIATQYARLRDAANEHGFTETAERLRHRQLDAASPALVMVVGRGKAGKSSLINSMLGRDLADVGRVPKSWTIDIFSKSPDETGTLRFRDGTERTLPIHEARAEKERHKPADDNANADGTFERTNLTDVVWNVDVSWPPAGLSLVDTAGLLQDRGDVARDRISLYGAEGLELRLNDPFLYFFGRADVVLWCVHATKVDERDSLEMLASALERLGGHRPHVLGVVTQWDRVTEEDRPRILARCRELYGSMVKEWVPSSNKVDASSPFSPAALRRRVEQIALGNGNEERLHRYQEMYRNDVTDLVMDLESVAEFLRTNCVVHHRLRTELEIGVNSIVTRISGEVIGACSDAASRGSASVDSIWLKSEDNRSTFGWLVSELLTQDTQLASAIAAAFRNVEDRIPNAISAAMAEAEWTFAAIGERGNGKIGRFKLDAIPTTSSRASIASISSLNIGSGVTGGAAMQKSSAELLKASSLFLPIAVVGGIVGSVVAAAQASEAKSSAREAIKSATESTASDVVGQIRLTGARRLHAALEQADAALQRVTGGMPPANAKRVIALSVSLTEIVVPASRRELLGVAVAANQRVSAATPIVDFARTTSVPEAQLFSAQGIGSRVSLTANRLITDANAAHWSDFCLQRGQPRTARAGTNSLVDASNRCKKISTEIRDNLIMVHGDAWTFASESEVKAASKVMDFLEFEALYSRLAFTLRDLQVKATAIAENKMMENTFTAVAIIRNPQITTPSLRPSIELSNETTRHGSRIHGIIDNAEYAARRALQSEVEQLSVEFARTVRFKLLIFSVALTVTLGFLFGALFLFASAAISYALIRAAGTAAAVSNSKIAGEAARNAFLVHLNNCESPEFYGMIQRRNSTIPTSPRSSNLTSHWLIEFFETKRNQVLATVTGKRNRVLVAVAGLVIVLIFAYIRSASKNTELVNEDLMRALLDPTQQNLDVARESDRWILHTEYAPYYLLSDLWQARPDLDRPPFTQ